MPGFDPDGPPKRVLPSILITGELLDKDCAVTEVEPGYISGFLLVVKIIVLYGSGHSVIIHLDMLWALLFGAGDASRDNRDLILGRVILDHSYHLEEGARYKTQWRREGIGLQCHRGSAPRLRLHPGVYIPKSI